MSRRTRCVGNFTSTRPVGRAEFARSCSRKSRFFHFARCASLRSGRDERHLEAGPQSALEAASLADSRRKLLGFGTGYAGIALLRQPHPAHQIDVARIGMEKVKDWFRSDIHHLGIARLKRLLQPLQRVVVLSEM